MTDMGPFEPLRGFMAFATEVTKRDDALDMLAAHRARLVAIAKATALWLAERDGQITAPEALQQMRAQGVPGVDAVDPRFIGCIFRKGTGWQRMGWSPTGSHGRPVAIWGRG